MNLVQEFVSQSLLNFDVRPIRAGYLVPYSSPERLRLAVAEASSRWGGMLEPILPVAKNGVITPGWLEVARLLDPDYWVDFTGFDPSVLERMRVRLGAPWLMPGEQAPDSWSSMHLIGAYAPERIGALAVFLKDEPALRDDAALGMIEPDERPEWQRRGARITIESDLACSQAQLFDQTPAGATLHQCWELSAEGPFFLGTPGVLWIGRSDTWRDALEFWNTRALTRGAWGSGPVAIVTPDVATNPTFVETLTTAIGRMQASYEPDLFVWSSSLAQPQLVDVVGQMGLAITESGHLTQHLRGGPRTRDLDQEPIQVAVGKPPILRGKRTVGTRATSLVQIVRPRTMFHLDSPVSFNGETRGHVKVRFSGFQALEGPQREHVAKIFEPHATWGGGGLEIEVDATSRYEIALNIPTRLDVLEAAVADRGITISISDKGKLARGVMGLTDVRPFLNPLTLDVISALASPESRSLVRYLTSLGTKRAAEAERAIQAYGESVKQVSLTLGDIAGKIGSKANTVGPVVETLVAGRLLLIGLQLSCERCGLLTFLSMPDAQPPLACPGCGESADVQRTDKKREPALHYRLNTLVDRAHRQGILGHLYGVARLVSEAPESYVLPGADLSGDAGSREVDILAVRKTELLSGEVKSDPRMFSPKQLTSDIELSTALGADTHLMVCPKPIPDEVRQRAERTCKRLGINLSVLAPDGA
jgi:hypothetical protein